MRIEEKDGNLAIVDFDEVEAYKIARKIEKDGIEFYRRLLAKTTQAKAKDALKFLLEEEKGHLEFFEDRLQELEQKAGELTEDDDLLGSLDYGIFWPYQNIEELENIVDDPRKALKLGLVIEDKSLKFYQSCQGKVTSPEVREEIANIIREESRHKKILEDTLI